MLEGVIQGHGLPVAGVLPTALPGKIHSTIVTRDAIQLGEAFVIDADLESAWVFEGMRHDFGVNRQVRIMTMNPVAEHFMKRQESFLVEAPAVKIQTITGSFSGQ